MSTIPYLSMRVWYTDGSGKEVHYEPDTHRTRRDMDGVAWRLLEQDDVERIIIERTPGERSPKYP